MSKVTKLMVVGCLWVLIAGHIALAQSWEFNTNGNRESWSTNNVESWSVNGGIFYIDPASVDPYIERTGLSLSASSYNTIYIRMASNAPDGGGTIYFQTSTSSGWVETRNVHFSIVNQPGGSASYYEYKIFMAYHPQWQGTITGIRIDPANNGQSGTNLDTIGIDFIRLISSSDRPSIVNQSLSPASAMPGTTITFNYTISNPFSSYMPYRFDTLGMRLGARIRPAGTSSWVDDPANDQVIMLQPGPPAGPGSRTYSRSYRISPSASSGSYDAGWVLVVQSVSPEQWISERVVSGALQVTAANFTLTVNKAGTGSGTVTSSPSGVNCGTTCSAQFASGTSVMLTPNAASGSTFASWSGCDSTSGNQCTVTMNANRTVTATFNTSPQPTFTLTVNKTGSGSGTVTSNPAGINCGSTCQASFNSGTSVTLTPSAASGSTFASWSGCDSTSGNQCTVTMNANRTVTATFNTSPQPTFALTVNKTGSGSGTVTSNPAGINCGSTCQASFNSGTSVTLTPSAASGSTFVGWSGACSGTGNCTLIMDANKSATAAFNSGSQPTFDGFQMPISDLSVDSYSACWGGSYTTVWTGQYNDDGKGRCEGTGRHGGVDIPKPEGHPIVAAATGEVVQIQRTGSNGGTAVKIVLKHNVPNIGIVYSSYLHMKSGSIPERNTRDEIIGIGTIVSRGEKIGEIGNTGLSSGNHLHFEIVKDGAGCYICDNRDTDSEPSERIPQKTYNPIVFIASYLAGAGGPQDRTLVRVVGDNTIYWMQNRKLYQVTDPASLNRMITPRLPRWRWDQVYVFSANQLQPYLPTGQDGRMFVMLDQTPGANSIGLLLRQFDDSTGKVYRIEVENGQVVKRWITTASIFDERRYDWKDVIDVTGATLDFFPTGSPIGNPLCVTVTASSTPRSVTYTPTPTRPFNRTIYVAISNNSDIPQTVRNIVPQTDEPFVIVNIRPTLPRIIRPRSNERFTIVTQRAAGLGNATARTPYFDITLDWDCGMLKTANESRLLIPLNLKELRAEMITGQLRVEVIETGIASLHLQFFDLSGRLVVDRTSNGSVLTVRPVNSIGQPLANGVYLYIVRVRGFSGEEYVSAVRKLVILR